MGRPLNLGGEVADPRVRDVTNSELLQRLVVSAVGFRIDIRGGREHDQFGGFPVDGVRRDQSPVEAEGREPLVYFFPVSASGRT